MKLWIVLFACVAMIGCGGEAAMEKPAADEAPAAPATDETDAGDTEAPATEDGAATSALSGDGVTLVSFNATDAPVVEFNAPGMHCEVCAATVVKALKDKPGILDVKADSETKVVKVAVNESEFDKEAVAAAINETGFGEETGSDEAS